ncbi:MAG: zf-HC2 domain-containing protein [Clostridia bacterium]|jgi:hypothetical protein
MKEWECREIILLLPWYVNESLTQDENAQVAAHVAGCASCRKQLVQLVLIEKPIQEYWKDPLAEDQATEMFDSITTTIGLNQDSPSSFTDHMLEEIYENPVPSHWFPSILAFIWDQILRDTAVLWKYKAQIKSLIQESSK